MGNKVSRGRGSRPNPSGAAAQGSAAAAADEGPPASAVPSRKARNSIALDPVNRKNAPNKANFVIPTSNIFDELYVKDKKELGSGHYGKVSKCWPRGEDGSALRDQTLAVKAIAKSKIKTRETDALVKEIQLLQAVNHPNIIKMHDVCEDEAYLYIITELCTGGELFDRIIEKTKSSEKHFSEVDAARLTWCILDALEYCHNELNIVHRDLKPENFLFRDPSDDSDIVIIDFGLSRFGPDEQVGYMKTKVGTPYYIAPEVLSKHYDKSCDLWSVGVVVYILLSGIPPFYGDTDKDIFRMIQNEEVDFPSEYGWDGVSDMAKTFIRRLLNKTPGERPTAAEAKLDPWMQVNDAAVDVGAAGPNPTPTDLTHRLERFVGMNKLKRCALKVMADAMNQEEIGQLGELFRQIDTDGSGTLSIAELEQALSQSHGFIQTELHEILEGIDLDGNQQLDYSEFLAATMQRSHFVKDDKIFRAYQQLCGGKDSIDMETLIQIVGSPTDAQAVMDQFDTDHSGVLEFEEFKQMIKGFNSTVYTSKK